MDGNKDFLEFVYSFNESMESKNVKLVYKGEITHQVTKAFTSITETNMMVEEEPNSVQKKVFHVIVEFLQNISKHADYMGDESHEEGSGVFLLCKDDENYVITTGNILMKQKEAAIGEVLDKINSLDKEGLKALYKQQIKEGRLSDKGGAGLGFIDIAKKTGNPLDYKFVPLNDEFSFFIISSTISRTQNFD
ncbi:MAG: SiaB family protein kinase [Salinivirgaceae bacterium]|nr:SiaB family protein kinase [Salinivirgaceae bacterium]MBR6083276.1 SiaB family protein kinase [Salinivirgaceae bacterium]